MRIFISENIGEFEGKIKFDNFTIDDYVTQAIGAAFPILVEGLGFVFCYDDLEARKNIIGEEKFRVNAGDIMLIPDGAFHRVINDGEQNLVFNCVFDGNRNH